MNLTISEALQLSSREMVCAVGGGGKTTLILSLASEGQEKKHPVIVTTTTKMGLEEDREFLTVMDEKVPPTDQVVRWIGGIQGERVLGRDPKEVDVCFSDFHGWVLVEADGARRRPIKAPASHEPVIPSQATLVVLNIGLDAVKRSIGEVAHRPELLAEILEVDKESLITPQMIASLVTHDQGGRKWIPDSSRFILALTKCTEERRQEADQIIEVLAEHENTPEKVVLIGRSGEILDLNSLK